MKEFIKKYKFNITILIIYATITLIGIIFHENWRDEAQSWLIARDLNFIDIFKQMKFEGHPCLWHFIIAPFVKLGFPYFVQNIIAWLIMCTTTGLILWKLSFNKYVKILIIFSAPFLYYYSVIARSYCLIPLAIVLIAITYKNRKEKPIQYVLSISFLAHTHVLMLGLVGILYLFFFFEELILKFNKKTKEERRLIIISFVIAIVGLILLFLQLFSSIDTNSQVEGNMEINNDTGRFLYEIVVNIVSKTLGNENYGVIVCVISILMAETISQLINNTKNTLIMLIGIGFQLGVYLFIYADLSYQKIFTSLFIIIFCYFIQDENQKKISFIWFETSLVFILMLNCILGINAFAKDVQYEFSDAKNTAEFINYNINESSTFIVSSIPYASAIIPYTNSYKFWSPQINNYYTFVTWNADLIKGYTLDEFEKTIVNNFENRDNIYFIYCYNWGEGRIRNFS